MSVCDAQHGKEAKRKPILWFKLIIMKIENLLSLFLSPVDSLVGP